MADPDACVLDGLALTLVGPDTVGHDGTVIPHVVLCVGLPVLLAVGMQFLDPGDLAGVLGQVGLDGQILLSGQLAQELHQLIGAGGGEAGGDDGLDMLEVALLDPLDGLVHGFLSGLLVVLAAVAVHVDLADIAGDASLLHCVTALPRRVVEVPPCDDVTPPCDAGREGLDVTAVLRLEPEVGRDAAEPPSTPTLLLLTPPLPDVTFALPAELLTFEPELPREG